MMFGGADVVEIAGKYGTPLFIYDEERIRENFRAYRDSFPDAEILYAIKANGNLSILRILAQEGAGADAFSECEIKLAIRAGIPRDKILFNGNSKSRDELEFAVKNGIMISVDSLDELGMLEEVCESVGKEINVAFRYNPRISVRTHRKIATGVRKSKFGMGDEIFDAYKIAYKSKYINAIGIHSHIGSQIMDVGVYAEEIRKMMKVVEKVKDFIDVKFFDIGGGLGIPYREGERALKPRDLARVVLPEFERWCSKLNISPKLALEPGRSIVGNACVLVCRVNSVKRGYKNFVAVDAGFNLVPRPVIYGAYHRVAVANKYGARKSNVYTIVGPICESGDILAEDRKLPKVERGDLIAVFDVGAYCFSMSSQYNARPRCAELLVRDGNVRIIRDAEGFEDLIMRQKE